MVNVINTIEYSDLPSSEWNFEPHADIGLWREGCQAPLSVRSAVERFLADRRMRNLSEHTLRMYSDRLSRLCSYLEKARPGASVATVTVEDLKRHVEQEIDRGLSTKTINTAIQCIKTLFKFLVEEELIDHDPSVRLVKRRAEKRVIRPLRPEEVQRILDVFDRKSPTGARDRALVVLLYANGLRISEATSIKLTDIDWQDGCIRVKGKGRKERLAYLHPETKRVLRTYAERHLFPVGAAYLFPNRYGLPISRRSAARIIKKAGESAGIDGVHPHRFRHSFAIGYLRQGGDPLTLQRELGHSSLDMVNHYVNIADSDIKDRHHEFSPVSNLELRRLKAA